MALFCKKNLFSPLPSSPLLDFTNALRPDSPSCKFRGQQNYSDNSEDPEDSESTEETESTEGTESAEGTEAPVSEPREPVPANRPAPNSDRHSYCLLRAQTAKACRYLPKLLGLYSRFALLRMTPFRVACQVGQAVAACPLWGTPGFTPIRTGLGITASACSE